LGGFGREGSAKRENGHKLDFLKVRHTNEKAPPMCRAGPDHLPIYFDVNAGAPFSPDFHVGFSDTPTLLNRHIGFTDALAYGDVWCTGAVFPA
jgi:hypothetical protein